MAGCKRTTGPGGRSLAQGGQQTSLMLSRTIHCEQPGRNSPNSEPCARIRQESRALELGLAIPGRWKSLEIFLEGARDGAVLQSGTDMNQSLPGPLWIVPACQGLAKLRDKPGVDVLADASIDFRGIDAIARQVEQDRRLDLREQAGEPIGLLQIQF